MKKYNIDLGFLEKSNLKWINDRSILISISGSISYGTNSENSDIDIRGVAVPPKEYFFGVQDVFEQAQFSEPYDCVIFDIRKFFKLAIDNNPNILELLFTDDKFIIKNNAEKILNIRDLFLSKKAKFTYAGYAHSQIKRMELHKQWIRHPFIEKPKRENFGLSDIRKNIPSHQLLEIDAAINKKLDEWNIDTTGMEKWAAIDFKNNLQDVLTELKIYSSNFDEYAVKSIGLSDQISEEFIKERKYSKALKDYKNFQEWKQKRNSSRYALEEKFGFDCKFAMHVIRLYRTCKDILITGTLKTFRDDAVELLEIRNGIWSFDRVLDEAKKLEAECNELYEKSTLRKVPETKKINEVLIQTIEGML